MSVVSRLNPSDAAGATKKGVRPRLWDSSVTSYYLSLGSTLLLTGLGLGMVLAGSSVTAVVSVGSLYATFITQARWALIGLRLLWGASRLPTVTYRRMAWVILGVAVFLQLPV